MQAEQMWARLIDVQQAPTATNAACVKLFHICYAEEETRFSALMLDEAHDATEAQMHGVLRIPKCGKLLVLDEHQSINSFRKCISQSALAALPATYRLTLSKTWRYGMPLSSAAANLIRFMKPETGRHFEIRPSPSLQTAIEVWNASLPVQAAIAGGVQLAVLGSKAKFFFRIFRGSSRRAAASPARSFPRAGE
eukprot:5726118-Prymnesium_polylepis.1